MESHPRRRLAALILVAALLALLSALTGERVYAATGAASGNGRVYAAAASGNGRWAAPLDGRLRMLAPFDPPARRWLSGHRGIDLAGSDGEPVRAVADGVVVWAGPIAGVGVVSVQHADGLRSTYQPVEAAVGAGDAVLRGDVLGTLASDGHCVPRVCLHLGARRESSYLDPALLLGLRPPRLLPYLSAGALTGDATALPPGGRSESAATAGASAPAAEPSSGAGQAASRGSASSRGPADLTWRQVVQDAAPAVITAVLRGVAAWLSSR